MEKIGFVGVGRMGSYMARRLKDQGFPIAAVYDVNLPAAATLAQKLCCQAATELKTVTELSDVIITVVSDDKAMKGIFTSGMLILICFQDECNHAIVCGWQDLSKLM